MDSNWLDGVITMDKRMRCLWFIFLVALFLLPLSGSGTAWSEEVKCISDLSISTEPIIAGFRDNVGENAKRAVVIVDIRDSLTDILVQIRCVVANTSGGPLLGQVLQQRRVHGSEIYKALAHLAVKTVEASQ